MTLKEAIKKYGLEKAVKFFDLSDHAVITLHTVDNGNYVAYVTLQCGKYYASEPTIYGSPAKTTAEAIEKLKRPFKDNDITFEALTVINK